MDRNRIRIKEIMLDITDAELINHQRVMILRALKLQSRFDPDNLEKRKEFFKKYLDLKHIPMFEAFIDQYVYGLNHEADTIKDFFEFEKVWNNKNVKKS